MRIHKLLSLLTVLLVGLGVAACATGGGTEEEEFGLQGDDLAIEVQNNLTPPTSVTVTLVAENGTPSLLGAVEPGTTTTLAAEAEVPAGDYHLVAETTDGEEIVSRPFTVGDVSVLTWDLSLNSVNLGVGTGR